MVFFFTVRSFVWLVVNQFFEAMPRCELNENFCIQYDTFGDSNQGEPLILIMGFAASLTVWRDNFCSALADAGFYVIRFDNRDTGLSSRFSQQPQPPIPKHVMYRAFGWPLAPRTLCATWRPTLSGSLITSASPGPMSWAPPWAG